MTCSYKECFVPDSRHNRCAAKGLGKCWGRLEHQHVPKRSQTPRAERQCPVRLCQGHHSAIDNGGRYEGLRIADRVHECKTWGAPNAERNRVYEIYDRGSGDILINITLRASDMGGGEPTRPDGGDDLAGTFSPPSVPGASD